jgi:uncharacterized protein with HEPN domain
MNRNVAFYLTDILQNMRDAEEFVLGLSYEQFAADKKTFNAVVRSIEIIGEAAKYPAVPWKEMAGMRDKVIHFQASDRADRARPGHSIDDALWTRRSSDVRSQAPEADA